MSAARLLGLWATGGLLFLRLAAAETETSSAHSKLLPLDRLTEESRKLALRVTARPTFELDLGPHRLEGRMDIFEYLLDHLDVCAVAGRVLRVGNYTSRLEKDGRLFGDDGEGATGYLTFLLNEPGKRVFYVDGQQKGIFNVAGHSVGVLDFETPAHTTGVLEYRLHLWIRVDNRFFAFLSRVFLGASRNTAHRQFTKMLSIPVGVTQKIHDDPRAAIEAIDASSEEDRATLRELRQRIEDGRN